MTQLDHDIGRAIADVTRNGRHLSTVIDELFTAHRPDAEMAADIRSRIVEAVRTMPEWLRQRIRSAHGDRAARILEALRSEAPVFIRVNTLKTTDKDALRALREAGAESTELEHCLVIARPFGLYRRQPFHDGWFEQQDISSQRVALSMDLAPGMRVVDACAGNGGKTLHMAALMGNKGRIIALDPYAEKLSTLRTRAARAGVSIVEPRVITSTKTVKRLAETADRVLVDVPCSGTGVLRRNPDIPWHLTDASIDELVSLQRDILRRSANCAKPGGLVVYASCSILPDEGPYQIRAFLDQAPFTLESEWTSIPDNGPHSGDGFYCAVLRRNP